MPALVVARAVNPASMKIRALAASQALGSTGIGPSRSNLRSSPALSTHCLPLARVPACRRYRDVGLNVLVLR